ncbi:hypothetical protein HK098_006832 [Nowakowskiella sp. JEL0407]|nr:hypothetical protein HK098_006832 [Nowakowskiella sp. JEL0407]
MVKKIAIVGSGTVALKLASGFIKHGFPTMLGTRTPSKLADFQKEHPTALVSTVPETCAYGDIVVLCVKGAVAVDSLKGSEAAINGKTVIDTTNPIDEQNSTFSKTQPALKYFTNGPNDSLMGRLQTAYPEANFVKAFNSIGNGVMVNPKFEEGKSNMFICGNSEAAKNEVNEILEIFGHVPVDVGLVESAGAVESLCVLWCATMFKEGIYNHGFQILRK